MVENYQKEHGVVLGVEIGKEKVERSKRRG